MPYDVAKVKEIFLAALEIPRPTERQKYVDSACGTDADLRNCVQDMLDAHQKLLTPVPLGPTVAESAPSKPFAATLPAGTVIDQRYKIIELIAEGGMGAVYRACRVADMRMEVAIKLVKPGMASEQILQRFNIERQALALMKHENIAKVLDAGSTREGYPYFVMELVKGLPITRFCDDNKLTVHERLELFEKVCLAVQHAHQKGIVHRDLKPSNILVALYDDKPVPKVIDFGLAKALNQPLTDDILHTKFGTFVGTWQYTAPEQAVLNNLDIDTRADIYSLGVILYELLTGNPPIEKSRITHAVMEEVLRIIREEEPPKPSTKIHSSEQLPSIAALRRSEPVQLEREIRGELDWIVMKALEKDRNRRYSTANDLARDLTAYLLGEQVTAAPPSKMYRMRCFYRKHRAKVLTIAAIAALLLIAAFTSTIGYIQVKRSEMKAKEQLAAANALADFIDRGMFASIDPLERAKFNLPMENNVLVRDMLARSAVSVESGAFSDQPVVEMRIRFTLGKAFFAIGENDAASKQLASSDKIAINLFGDMSEERLIILEKKGDVAYNQGNYSQAKNDYQLASTGWHTQGKGNSHSSLMAQIKKLEIEKSETEKPEILQSLVLQVESLLKQIAEAQDHVSFVQASLLLIDLHSLLNQPDKVLTELESTLRYARQQLGPDHPNTMAVMNSLAGELHARQKVDAAEKTYQDLMKMAERVYDADNIILALYRNNYAALCVERKNYSLADKLFQEAIPIFQKVSPNHPYTLIARSNVADMKLLKRDYAGALAVYQELAPLFLTSFGERRTEYQTLLRDMSRSLIELDKIDDAIVQLKKLVKIAVDTSGNESQQLMLGLKLIKRSLAQKNKTKAYDNMIEQLAEYLRQLSPNQSQLLNSIRGVK